MFGPWNVETPRATFLQAEYGLEYADFATINGLQGILASVGSFSGPLDYLSIKGTTDTPNFTRRSVGNPIALHTYFVAAVDGTNGNTYLQRVVAHFLHSTLVATGEVVDLDREPPVDLEASSESARVEDLIRLAAKTAEPILTGLTRLKAKIHIAEEDADLDERLGGPRSSGSTTGNSPTPTFQEKVDSLSRKGQGQPKNNEIAHVNSQLTGAMQRFTARVFLNFLGRLLRLTRKTRRKVFLIVDGHPVHKARSVTRWLAEHREQIRIFFLPSYSPEL